jgi:hypothetical protein
MRKLLALLPAAALLVLQGCGDSCTTAGTTIIPSGTQTCNGATVGMGSTITVSVKPSCQTCVASSPKCEISPLGGGQVQLDTTVQECDSDKGCTAPSCSFQNVSCAFTPNASGPLQNVYLPASGGTGSVTVTVDTASPAVSCTI